MKKIKLPKIGLRQIKTALSVFICLCIFQLMGKSPVYACIAAIICMQTTLENSISKGADRVAGTVIGGILGLLFSLTNLLYYNTWLYFLLITIGIIVVIYCNILLKKPGSVAISCVVFLIIMVNAESISERTVETTLLYTVNRVIDTSIGVAVGVAVNTLIKKKKETDDEIEDDDVHETDSFVNSENINPENINAEIINAESINQENAEEYGPSYENEKEL